MRIPRKVALFGATVLMLALIPASSAVAYNPKEKASEKRQNARTQKLAKDLTAAKKSLLELGPKVDGIDGRLKGIEAAAPQLVKGLNDLKDASLALKAGLESLKSLATSTEYGVGQVFVGATPVAGAFVVTPDIPDAVQQAQASGTFIASSAGTITVRVGVRSAESDGDGTTPAAHCRVTVIGSGGSTTTSKPNPALGGAPFWGINQKSAQTSTDPANAGFPFGPKATGADADNLVDLTDIGGTGNAVPPLGAGTQAASSGAGQQIKVDLSCVDTSPSTSDPTA